MADSGSLNRLGFGKPGAFPTSPAKGAMAPPSTSRGEYANELYGNFVSGTGGREVVYPLNHTADDTPLAMKFFKMKGTDNLTTAADTWIVVGAADTNGSFYNGSLTKPLRDVIVLSSWVK